MSVVQRTHLFVILSEAERSRRTSNFRERSENPFPTSGRRSAASLPKLMLGGEFLVDGAIHSQDVGE